MTWSKSLKLAIFKVVQNINITQISDFLSLSERAKIVRNALNVAKF
jgi:hypothetical protein